MRLREDEVHGLSGAGVGAIEEKIHATYVAIPKICACQGGSCGVEIGPVEQEGTSWVFRTADSSTRATQAAPALPPTTA